MTVQTIEIPMPLGTGGDNRREHWSARRRRAQTQRQVVTWALDSKCSRPRCPCTVTLVRVAPRMLDDDNLGGCFKHIRDAIAAWIGRDDRPGSGITWRYDQDRGAPRYQAARIIIEGDVTPEVQPLTVPELAKAAHRVAEVCA